MPVRKLSWAIESRGRCCENPRITARPRASDVMKFGSPDSAAMRAAAVTGASSGAGCDGTEADAESPLVAERLGGMGTCLGRGGLSRAGQKSGVDRRWAIIARYFDNRH